MGLGRHPWSDARSGQTKAQVFIRDAVSQWLRERCATVALFDAAKAQALSRLAVYVTGGAFIRKREGPRIRELMALRSRIAPGARGKGTAAGTAKANALAQLLET